MRYADEIFSLGQEFTSTMKERPTGQPLRFCVGIADVLPKVIAFRLIEPALRLRTPIHVICREDRPDHLLADLAVHDVDVVLSDAPASPAANIRAFNHLLGECGVSFLAPKKLAFLKKGFPGSLDGVPFLLPLDNTALRRDLDEWFHSQELRPAVMGEFADLALLRVFAEEGFGVFAVATGQCLTHMGLRTAGPGLTGSYGIRSREPLAFAPSCRTITPATVLIQSVLQLIPAHATFRQKAARSSLSDATLLHLRE